MFTFEVHQKPGYTGRCKDKQRKIALDISVVGAGNITLLTLPAKLVTDQNHYAEQLKAEPNSKQRFVEAMIMKHMPSNFLSWLHLTGQNILEVLSEMSRDIASYKEVHKGDFK